MRLSAVFVALVSTASGLSLFGGDQAVVADDDLKIPGESPLELCPGVEHADDIVSITSVDLLPNPPLAYVLFLMT